MSPEKITGSQRGDKPMDAAELRSQAEARLRESRQGEAARPGTQEETQGLIHELQVRQTELEMQNEELQQTRRELKTVLEQYTGLYEFAPVGYFTLDRAGTIRQANLRGARLFGVERPRLVDRPFGLFVTAESLPIFNALLEKAYESRTNETCEISFPGEGNQPLYAHIEAQVSEDGQTCRLAFVDITEREQAERTLEENGLKYQSLLDNQLNGIAYCKVVVDANNRPVDYIFLDINDAFVTITGLKKEIVLGKRITEIIPGFEKSAFDFIGVHGKVALTGEEIRFEQYQEHLKRWYSVYVYSPKKGYFVSIFSDITERMQAEQALRASEDKFKYFFDHSVVGRSLTLPSGEINVNQAFCEMLGYTPEELQHKRWQEISHPDDVEQTQKAVDLLLSGEKESQRFNKRYLHKSGAVVWVDVITSLRRDEEGKPLYFITSLIDITERKQAEDALRESERRFREMLTTVRLIAVMLDLQGTVTFCNDFLLELTGWQRQEVIGQNWFSYFLPDQMHAQVEAFFTATIQTGTQPSHYENEIVTRQGEPRLIVWDNTLLRDRQGQIIGTASLGVDITESKQAERKINEQIEELRRWQTVTLGREDRILDLKRELNELLEQAGKPPRYPSAAANNPSEENP